MSFEKISEAIVKLKVCSLLIQSHASFLMIPDECFLPRLSALTYTTTFLPSSRRLVSPKCTRIPPQILPHLFPPRCTFYKLHSLGGKRNLNSNLPFSTGRRISQGCLANIHQKRTRRRPSRPNQPFLEESRRVRQAHQDR